MAQDKWKIGSVKFDSEEAYQDGLKDLALIRLIRKENDISDPDVAKALYQKLRFQKGVFKTAVGKRFYMELARTVAQAESEAGDADVPAPSFLPLPEADSRPAKGKGDDIRRERPDGTQKKAWLLVVAIASILVLFFCIISIVSYSLMGYHNSKDMSELRSMIGESRITIEIDDAAADFAYTVSHQDALKDFDGVADKYSELYKLNDDLVGWVSVADTRIDYPVMQNEEDGEYYLHRGFDGEDNDEGLPFLDERCTISPNSDNLLIYGHNMKNGHMFADLMRYDDESFFKEHRIIRFDTVYEEGLYEIIAAFRTHVAYEGEEAFRFYGLVNASGQDEFDKYIRDIKKLSLYDTGVTAVYGDSLLTLSTCEYTEQDGRFVVVAKKVS